jgi:hypothetical protein
VPFNFVTTSLPYIYEKLTFAALQVAVLVHPVDLAVLEALHRHLGHHRIQVPAVRDLQVHLALQEKELQHADLSASMFCMVKDPITEHLKNDPDAERPIR